MNECGSGSRKAETLARAAASEDQALRHLAARRYDASIRCFTAAIKLDFTNPEYHLGRALAYACRGDFPMAVGDFTMAISVDPGNVAAYRGRGLAYARIGNYKQAMGDLDEAIRLDPLNTRAHLARDVSQLLKASYEGTIADLLRRRQGRPIPPAEKTGVEEQTGGRRSY